MSMTEEDVKQVIKLMRDDTAEVLEQVIYPQLVEIQNQIKASGLALEKKLTDKINGVESSLGNRIDNVAKIVTETKTNHERRIKKLEDEVGIFAD
jgi:CII-binding regulator of phage lambda lysogenization HflD